MTKINKKLIISKIPSSAKFFNSHMINYFNINSIDNLLTWDSEVNNVRIDLKIYNFKCDAMLVKSCCYFGVRHQLIMDDCLENNEMKNGGNVIELGYFWNDYWCRRRTNPRNDYFNLTKIRKDSGKKYATDVKNRFPKRCYYFRKAHKGNASKYLLKTLEILEQIGKINIEKDVFCLMTKDENPEYNEDITGLRNFYESLGLIEYDMYEKHNGSKNWYYYCDYKIFKNKLKNRVENYEKIKKERRKSNKLKKLKAKQLKKERELKKAEQNRIMDKNNYKWKIIEAYENTIRGNSSEDEEPQSVSGKDFYGENSKDEFLEAMLENEVISKKN